MTKNAATAFCFFLLAFYRTSTVTELLGLIACCVTLLLLFYISR